jgi:hypothetical protein
MTYLQLCQRTWREIGMQGDGMPAVDNQSGIILDVVTWVQQAWLDIQNAERWNFLRNDLALTLLSGQGEVAVSASVMLEIDQSHGWVNGSAISWANYGDFLSAYPLPALGSPSVATLSGDGRTVRFNALATSDLPVRLLGWKPPQLLSSNLHVPTIPDSYHMAIVWRAVILYAGREEAGILEQKAQRQYDDLIRRMMRTELDAIERASGWSMA